jgi:hypothetical protein
MDANLTSWEFDPSNDLFIGIDDLINHGSEPLLPLPDLAIDPYALGGIQTSISQDFDPLFQHPAGAH